MKNRLFYRIYSDGERVLEGCTDFPGSISRPEIRTLANDIDAATDKLMGEHVEDCPEVPEGEEPEPLRKPNSAGKPFAFHVLLSKRDGEQEIKRFKAVDGDFFVIHKSPWNGGVSFQAATKEDYEELGKNMPADDALQAAYERGKAEFECRCLPSKHPKQNGFSGTKIDKDTPAKRIAELVQFACYKDFEDYNDMRQYYSELRRYAQEGLDEVQDTWHYRNAKYRAERMFVCYHECEVRKLNERKRKAICKTCRRNETYADNFSNGKESKA